MLREIVMTSDYIKQKISAKPEVGIILGSGLGGLVDDIDVKLKLDYVNIPNFPVSTVEGHSGCLIFGTIGKKNIVALQGRFHFYEGYSMQELAFPVRVLKQLGIETLILSNASGGVNPDFEIGDIMIINDHINLLPANPLIGENIYELGPRFLDMHNAYDKNLIEEALKIAAANDINCKTGVYAAVSGPCYETPAEYRYIRNIGADAVGMSTVPEVITARHMGIPCFALSIITDLGVEGKIVEISHQEVVEVAHKTAPQMTRIIKELVGRI